MRDDKKNCENPTIGNCAEDWRDPQVNTMKDNSLYVLVSIFC